MGKEQTSMVLTEVNMLTGCILSEGYESILKNDMGLAFKKQEYHNYALLVYLDEMGYFFINKAFGR